MRAFIRFSFAFTTFAVLLIAASAFPISSHLQPQSDYLNRQPPPISVEARREMEARLSEARTAYQANPQSADAAIWVGRRLAYLGRFREAIDFYTEAIQKFPRDARLYRHRGHRYITTRQFELAIADLSRAAKLVKGKPDEIEPDGQPNARNIPTSTLQFNIWYHLGLAHYFLGNNRQALASYRECLKVSKSPDRLVATTHWLYMTLRRLRRAGEADRVLAPITPQMEIIENASYHRLLLMYKGLISATDLEREVSAEPASASSLSILYGIGNWHLYNGQPREAIRIYEQMLGGDQWTSFGYVAAEADLKRLR
ncbi:MAG TPA: tetratricopeptide repeat protein [Pyrinomonadaceae bacterium]|nr:tetratricopeptide repeat protein [Pyrinomonadaceae bacterium]